MAKVLIIEDDQQIRMVYSYALNNNGFEVLEAPDAVTGLKLLEQHKPEIVLLDMLMPGISGLDFLKQNNVHHRYPDIKIIAFSNIETPRVVEEAKQQGVVKYFLKVDVTPHQMVDIIKQLLGDKAAT
jgi:DNA-binding NtrC family response regulator